MKKAAFKLVGFMVGFQLLIVSTMVVGCLVTGNERCTGENIQKIMSGISAQAFALYAAEK